MNVGVCGYSSGIGQATVALLRERGHVVDLTRDPPSSVYDCIVFCAGHDYAVCVLKLIEFVPWAKSLVVVTSEFGTHPTAFHHVLYQSTKAAQKMVCRCVAKSGKPCVDVSPAFVIDSGKNKKINLDDRYRGQVIGECVGEFPVRSADVARAIVFAVENCGKLSGSTIAVGAGWRV